MLWRNGVVHTQRTPRYDHTHTFLNVRLELRIVNKGGPVADIAFNRLRHSWNSSSSQLLEHLRTRNVRLLQQCRQ